MIAREKLKACLSVCSFVKKMCSSEWIRVVVENQICAAENVDFVSTEA